jgi:ribonuclease BN (tRNA processing enzyme)
MVMDITFLGSGDALGSGGRFQACLAIRAGPDHLLLDCGASSLIAMRRFGTDPTAVDAVIVSHLHGDHFGGIPFLVLAGQFGRRTRPLRIAGPPGVEARVRAAMEVLFPGASTAERRFALEFVELHPGRETRIGTVAVTPYEVVHPSGAPALALRLSAGARVLAYSGDTAWTETLLDVARDADLFVCEAYFYEKSVRYHLDYRTLAAHRDRLGCRRLVLTHMSEDMLARLPLPGVEWAEDGQVVSL